MKIRLFTALLPATLILSLFCSPLFSQENCMNSIDDDGDGLIDFNDSDCSCNGVFGTSQAPASFIPNPSFEDLICCPQGAVQLDCAQTWIQASNPTSDFFHSCGFMTTAIPQPLADGEGCVGTLNIAGWQEYVGACLSDPIIANEDHLLKMHVASCLVSGASKYFVGYNLYGPIEITIYGSPLCTDLPFSGDGCPLSSNGDWQILGSVIYDPSHSWEEVSIELNSTVDIYSIAIGSPCALPPAYANASSSQRPYIMYDNLVVNQTQAFNFNLESNYYLTEDLDEPLLLDQTLIQNSPFYGQYCFDELVLNSITDTIGDMQWYQDGIAIPGETDTTLSVSFQNYLDGNYGYVLSINDSVCSYSQIETSLPLYPIAGSEAELICTPNFGNVVSVPDGTTTIIDHQWTINEIYDYTGESIDHFYEGQEQFYIRHIVTAENLCSDTIYQFVEMPALPDVNFYFEDVCENEEIHIYDSTQVLYGGIPINWNWGLPVVSANNTSQNQAINIGEHGTYDITLEVSTDQGCSSSHTQSIQVHPTPQAIFSLEAICYSDPIAFYENGSEIAEGNMNYTWQTGDGTTLYDQNPFHIYQDPGVYEVELFVTSDHGCADSISHQQIVSEVIADIEYGLTSGCHPHAIELNSTSTSSEGNIYHFEWVYSNGDTVFANTDTPIFTNYGHLEDVYYDIGLYVIDEYGCKSSIEKNELVEVWPKPLAQFEYGIDESNEQYQFIEFENTTIGAEYYQWDLGNGIFSGEEHPSSFYVDAESYIIELIAETKKGCLDTSRTTIEIDPAGYIYVPNSFTPNADGLNDHFFPSILGEVSEYSFEIYDRWGQIVFSSKEVGVAWNGSHQNNSEHYIMAGTYPYRLLVQFTNKVAIQVRNGMVTLIR